MRRTASVLLVFCLAFSACAAGPQSGSLPASPGTSSVSPVSSGASSSSAAAASSRSAAADSAAFAAAYHKISAEEAKQMMDAGGVTVLDVRTKEEYAAAHIPGAINIPLDLIGDHRLTQLPDDGSPILVYCRTGVRSLAACKALVSIGYTGIYDFGGITGWPYATEPSAG